MNAQMTDRLNGDIFIMMHFEIAFAGMKVWLEDAGMKMEDRDLFNALLRPDSLPESILGPFMQMVVYRYEDMLFQANRIEWMEAGDAVNEPVHQLLLQIINKRAIEGDSEALLELYTIIQADKNSDIQQYVPLHGLFEE